MVFKCFGLVQAVRPESCDSWEGAASIALAVKTLGKTWSISVISSPKISTGQITTRFVPAYITVLRDGAFTNQVHQWWKKKEIYQLWNLTGISIEQRGLFTKHPMVRKVMVGGRGKSLGRHSIIWRVPACLLLCYQSWIDFIFSQCPCSYYYLCSYSTSHRW